MASIIVGWLQSRHCLGCVANTRTHACTLTHIHTKWLDRVFFFSCSYSSSTRLFFHIASQLNGLSNCFLSLKKSLGSNDVFVVVFFSYKIPQCGMQHMICWNKTFLSPRSIFNRTYSATCGQQQHIYFKDRYRTLRAVIVQIIHWEWVWCYDSSGLETKSYLTNEKQDILKFKNTYWRWDWRNINLMACSNKNKFSRGLFIEFPFECTKPDVK